MLDQPMSSESASQNTTLIADDRLATQPDIERAAIAASPFKINTNIPAVDSSDASSKKTPLEAARDLANEFLQTLCFASQRSAYERRANEYIELFAEYYCESKNIIRMEKDRPRPSTKNCGCFFNFQPREGIKEIQAFKNLEGEANGLISTTLNSLGDLYLRGLKLNNGDRKQKLVEILATASADFAPFVLIECGLDSDIEPHDLVADFLLLHHKELMENKTNRTNIRQFTNTYRKVNNCGHEPLSGNKLFSIPSRCRREVR